MKLISCYISAFGKFKEESFLFDPNLNCFLEDNGYGKSTLAAFLKAMLYGMEGYKTNAKKFPDRMHYYPAGASKKSTAYGGSLIFEKDGNEYRIERFFDEKSEIKDTLTVYKNGSPCDELGETPGVTLFGIDAESFERTIFIDGSSVETGTTPDINRALNNVISALKEDVSADSAAKALEDAANKIRGKQKGKGRAAELEKELTDERLKIMNLRKIEGSLDEKYEKAKEIKRSIADHDLERKAIDKYKEAEGKIKVYEEKKNAASELEKKIKQVEEKYPKGIPEKEITDLLRDCASAENLVDSGTREIFADFTPSPDDFVKAESSIKELSDTERRASEEKIRRNTVSGDYEGLGKRFDSPDTAGVIENVNALNEKRHGFNSEIEEATENSKRIPKAGLGLVGKIFGILAILFGVLGLALVGYNYGYPAINPSIQITLAPLGIILLLLIFVLSGVCGLVSWLNFLSNKKKNRKEEEKLETALADIAAKRNLAETELRAYLGKIGYTNPNFDTAVASATSDYNRYSEIKKQTANFDSAISEYEKKSAELKSSIADFCTKIGINIYSHIPEQILSNLGEAKKKYSDYLKFKKAEMQVADLLSRLGLERPSKLAEYANEIDNDRKNCSLNRSELQKKLNEAEDYLKKECPDGLPAKPEFDAEAFENKKNDLSRELAKQEKEIEECENEISEIPVKEAKVAELESAIKALDEEKKVYLAAAAEIRAADKRIKDKYIGPVKSQLVTYLGAVDGFDEKLISVDGNYAVSVDLGGALKDDRFLSAGQKELLSFCQRLALSDNVFKNEQPFLILDDPFASLDKTRIEKMTRLIKKLGKERQILYFCCHESREIK